MSNVWHGVITILKNETIGTTTSSISEDLVTTIDTLITVDGSIIPLESIVQLNGGSLRFNLSKRWLNDNLILSPVTGITLGNVLTRLTKDLTIDIPNQIDQRFYTGNRLLNEPSVNINLGSSSINIPTLTQFNQIATDTLNSANQSIVNNNKDALNMYKRSSALVNMEYNSIVSFNFTAGKFMINGGFVSYPLMTDRASNFFTLTSTGRILNDDSDVSTLSYIPNLGIVGVYCDAKIRTNTLDINAVDGSTNGVTTSVHPSYLFESNYNAITITETNLGESINRFIESTTLPESSENALCGVILESNDCQYVQVGTKSTKATIDIHSGTIVSINDHDNVLNGLTVNKIAPYTVSLAWRLTPGVTSTERVIGIELLSDEGDIAPILPDYRTLTIHNVCYSPNDNRNPIDLVSHPLPNVEGGYTQSKISHLVDISDVVDTLTLTNNDTLSLHLEWVMEHPEVDTDVSILSITDSTDTNVTLSILCKPSERSCVLRYSDPITNTTTNVLIEGALRLGDNCATVSISNSQLMFSVNGNYNTSNVVTDMVDLSGERLHVINFGSSLNENDSHSYYVSHFYLTTDQVNHEHLSV